MPKKKKSPRQIQKKTSKKPMFRTRLTYGGVIAFLFILFFVAVTPIGIMPRSHVLGASTQTHSGGFSFSNFFASLFSFFTRHANSSPSQNGGYASTIYDTSQTATNATQVTLTQDQLDTLASNKYADGSLPLGDNKYTTTGPQKGYIYLCNVPQTTGGAEHAGSWLGTTTWTITAKPAVEGSVTWPNATFTNSVSGNTRRLEGNGLPVGMTTGVFPIASSDPASQYDRNPNTIIAQSIDLQLPTSPTYSDTPHCMGMEAGVMTNGVPLFNGFDAELRDAAAHEIQDSCDGHPQSGGEYHYHSLSSCFNNPSVETVIGFALDGFPITGGKVSNGTYLTTDNLDECHGITSQIVLDGKQVTMYHYVMTEDFPYSVSCFRGNPVSLQVIAGTGRGGHMIQNQAPTDTGNGGQGSLQQTGTQGSGMMNTDHQQPPHAAVTACSGKARGTSCSFIAPRGTVQGICQMPPDQTSEVCTPTSPEQNQNTPKPQ